MVSLRNLLKGSSSPDLWESAKLSVIEDVHITTEELGHGSFGVVYDAVYGGRRCVAKEIYPGLIEKGKSNYKSFIKEINILSTLRHPNIVYFLGVYFRQGSNVPVLITERMWMNLTNLLEKKSFIPHIIKVRILYDVACGLKFLHSQNPPVVHRSLNANNILLNKNIDAKLSDLGSARALETLNMQPMTTPLSNLDYVMPPEALNHDRMYTTKSDVFSFGCVLLHTLAQQLPLPSEQFQESQINKDLFIKVSEYERRSKYVEMIKDQCTHLINLLSICLKDKPVDRPDADKVCKLIEDYWNELKVKPDFSQLVIDYFQQDKISLVTSLDNQCTKAKELQSVVVKLEKSILSKDENNLSLKEYIDDLKGTIQHKEDMYFNMKKKVVYWEDQVTKEKAKV